DNQEIYTELMYNRLFSNNTRFKSYSLPFRPDYTLLIEYNSENYFVHFDAKYRSEGDVLAFYENIPQEQFDKDNHNQAIENEIETRDLEEETKRKFKYGDLYKMHTYKDAILKTEGAYVLYPGDDCKIFSVGAFPLTPGKNGEEENELISFIIAVIKKIIGNT
ncbi:MAG: nuclease domain-containing protein, partial [Methanobacterium sp.]|nr:nuclease domain-containing protein [Methanobacterium sp.]